MLYANLLLMLSYYFLFKCKKIQSKLGFYLYWNGTIRLFFEIFYEIFLLTVLNLHSSDWDRVFTSKVYSNVLSVIFVVSFLAIPIFLVIFSCVKRKAWNSDDFRAKYGAFLDGTKTKKEQNKTW